MSATETGRRGEDIAAAFLTERGYEIIQRNYYKDHGELDIVARQGGELVFVEVKTRRDRRFASAAEAVSHAKQALLRRTALYWLAAGDLSDAPARFDVVEVYTGKDNAVPMVRLIKNAF